MCSPIVPAISASSATQRPDDVVEMFTLSPYDLGPAIAGMVELTKPGARPVIVIPDYVPQSSSSP